MYKRQASAARVNEIFAVESSIVPGEQEVATVSGAPRVEWKDVSFAYAGSEEDALEHVTPVSYTHLKEKDSKIIQ